MHKIIASIVVIVCATNLVIAAPPKLEIPSEIQATGDYVNFIPPTDATNITYVSLSGVDPFPSGALKNDKQFILPVRGLKEGKYQFIAFATKKDEHTIVKFSVVVGRPKPIDPVEPDVPDVEPDEPDGDKAQTPDLGLYIVFIYETGKTVTSEQFNMLYSKDVRDFLNKNCKDYRVYDQNKQTDEQPWKEALSRPHKSIPWIVIMYAGKYVYEGPLPNTLQELKDILTKYYITYQSSNIEIPNNIKIINQIPRIPSNYYYTPQNCPT